ncbi:MAG TPA: serine hydrolase domain-containing protein [Candidatus Limnocylindrales bacterium]|nr:serine hydrolase domain-containing protein [Candidatus Limnocylindrales bacterium]
MTTAIRPPETVDATIPAEEESPAAEATTRPQPAPLDVARLRAAIDEILSRHATVGFALGVVREGHLAFFHGHGFADIEARTPITEDTVFRIASISKTFTAIAVMQLWEQGLVDLDAPANDYLRAFRLVGADPAFRPATIRHLLTHTAGIPEVVRPTDLLRPDWGDSIPLGEPMPTLARFYGEHIRLETEPGTAFAYTNHAFAALGQIVEDVSGIPIDRYLRQRIFEPLGMFDTDLLRSEFLGPRLATGYTLGRNGPEPVAVRDWVPAAAASVCSTTRDMARYVAALAGGGTNDHGTILRPDTLSMMFRPAFQPETRVPGMGLGFDRHPIADHEVIGHGGILPGFNSQLFVAPDDGVGVIALTTGGRLAMLWLPTEISRLLGVILGVPEARIRTDVPQRPEVWSDICGRYRFTGRITDIRARLMTGAGAVVSVDGDGLLLRFLSPIPALLRGFRLVPDDPEDPYVFRIDLARFGLSTARIVFGRDELGVTGMHADIVPMALRKVVEPTEPREVASPFVRALALSMAATAAVAAGRRLAARRRRPAA